MALEGCVSGAALGTALASLLLGRAREASSHHHHYEAPRDGHAHHQQHHAHPPPPPVCPPSLQDLYSQRPRTGTKEPVIAPHGETDEEKRKRILMLQHHDSSIERAGEEMSMVPGWQGFSMAEARQYSAIHVKKAKERKPEDILAELQRGNARFWTCSSTRPEKSAFERRALILKQFPHTAVLGCADSRVPIEVIFDQGLGDMFVVRVAGNCLGTLTTGSLEYAVEHLEVKVVVVLGHEGCGAVKAALLPVDQINAEAPALRESLKLMKAGLEEDRLSLINDSRARDREAVCTNVRRQLEKLMMNTRMMEKVRSDELLIVGAFYEISSGIVDFFMEVSGEVADAEIGRGLTRGVTASLNFTSSAASTPSGSPSQKDLKEDKEAHVSFPIPASSLSLPSLAPPSPGANPYGAALTPTSAGSNSQVKTVAFRRQSPRLSQPSVLLTTVPSRAAASKPVT